MNDVERDLRQLLLAKTADLEPVPMRAPGEVLRRGRRRQLGTVVTGVVSAVAIVAVSITGLQSLAGGDDSPPAVSNTTPAPPGGRLPWHAEGAATVATGRDLGSDWELRTSRDALTLTIDGDDKGLSIPTDSWIVLPAPGGAFLVASTSPRVHAVAVGPWAGVTNADGPAGPPVEGRWMPGYDLGREARIWLIPLSGAGSGLVAFGERPPSAISWPPGSAPFDGLVLMAGGAEGVNWAVVVEDHRDLPGDGTARYCLVAPVTADNATRMCPTLAFPKPLLTFGLGHAWVMARVPGGTTAVAHQNGGPVFPVCSDTAPSSLPGWEKLGICVAQFSGTSGRAIIRFKTSDGVPYAQPVRVSWGEASGGEVSPDPWP